MSSLNTDIADPGRPVLDEVSPGIFSYVQPDGTWWINNTGFLLGPQGVISIDTCSTRRRTQAYAEAIASVTTAPVRAVVNTHHHGDHTFGNCLFPTAAIVAHERTRAEAHGPVFRDQAPVDATLDYLRFLQDTAGRGHRAGLSPLEAATRTDLGRFADWPDAERLVGNLHRAYAELEGAPPGAQVDIVAALTEMVAYNGGRPLTCLA